MNRLSLTELDIMASLLSEVEGFATFIQARGTDRAEALQQAQHLYTVFVDARDERLNGVLRCDGALEAAEEVDRKMDAEAQVAKVCTGVQKEGPTGLAGFKEDLDAAFRLKAKREDSYIQGGHSHE